MKYKIFCSDISWYSCWSSCTSFPTDSTRSLYSPWLRRCPLVVCSNDPDSVTPLILTWMNLIRITWDRAQKVMCEICKLKSRTDRITPTIMRLENYTFECSTTREVHAGESAASLPLWGANFFQLEFDDMIQRKLVEPHDGHFDEVDFIAQSPTSEESPEVAMSPDNTSRNATTSSESPVDSSSQTRNTHFG